MSSASARRAGGWILLAFLVCVPAQGAFQLVLKDGKILSGADMSRENGNYVLIQANGERLTLPGDQVKEVRLVSDDVLLKEAGGEQGGAAPAEEEEGEERTGQTIAGEDVGDRVDHPDAATVGGMPGREMSHEAPQSVAGGQDRPLMAGEWRPHSDWPKKDPGWTKSAYVGKGPDNTWTPHSDYATDTEDNNWNPSTWTKPAIDPNWTPTDAYGRDTSAGSTWTPVTDGFKKTNTALRVPLPADAGGTTGGAGGSPAGVATMGSLAGVNIALEGDASWYGEAYRGRPTASGQPFDPDRLTAAHDTLPFGTLVMVTRLGEPQRSVVVEINDRGAGARIINLSQGAAKALDMLESGVETVHLGPVPDQLGAPPSSATAGGQATGVGDDTKATGDDATTAPGAGESEDGNGAAASKGGEPSGGEDHAAGGEDGDGPA